MLDFRTTEAHGRSGFAKMDIPAGTHLLTEKPYLSMPLPESRASVVACERCCKPLGTMAMQAAHLAGDGHEVELPLAGDDESVLADDVPCKTKCGARYCSRSCQEADAPAHAMLCRGTSKVAAAAIKKFESHAMETEELFLFAARFVVHAIASGTQSLSPFAALCRVPFWDLSDEGMDKTEEEKEEVRNECDTSRRLLLSVLSATASVRASSWLTLEAYGGLLGAIRRNAILVELSHPLRDLLPMLSEWRQVQPASSAEGKAVGAMLDALPRPLPECLWSAVYPRISCVNHSCRPSCEVQWFDESHGGTLVATRNIRKGEELYISYIPETVQADSVHARRASLRDYGFECDCDKCTTEAAWQRRLRPRLTFTHECMGPGCTVGCCEPCE